ncbi:zinc metalloproteinase nas-6-like isoform X2 [Tubulanus polymorphus]|uniref:zinc metalloproteinase nas-6-like isoform X2 n=1 Tax=Tubulanus polymorphus TaxID=672921 RepID=UPI003DA31425
MFRVAFLGLFLSSISAAPVQIAHDNDDVWLNSGFYQGDIDIDEYRNAMGTKNKLWKDGIVPYIIEDELIESYSNFKIQAAMDILSEYVNKAGRCITFKKRTNEDAYISFYKGNGCHSPVGSNGRVQRVSIGEGCAQIKTVQHEILHSLGFWHEQSRPDRDQYVTIHRENIEPANRYNFNIQPDIDTLGTPYSYYSIMHYKGNAFSMNGKPTITAKDPEIKYLGADMLSPFYIDVERIRILYGCPKNTL